VQGDERDIEVSGVHSGQMFKMRVEPGDTMADGLQRDRDGVATFEADLSFGRGTARENQNPKRNLGIEVERHGSLPAAVRVRSGDCLPLLQSGQEELLPWEEPSRHREAQRGSGHIGQPIEDARRAPHGDLE
jgi:hypothetical protein